MIYAIRKTGRRETLIEASRASDLQFADRPVAANVARKWVLDGKEHETGLWVDEGKVRYARAQEADAKEMGGLIQGKQVATQKAGGRDRFEGGDCQCRAQHLVPETES